MGELVRNILGEVRAYRDGDYMLELCDRSFIEKMIIAGHYSGTMPKNAKFCFAVFYKNKHEGALSLGYGIRPDLKTAWGNIRKEEYLEFDRMYLTDTPPRNSESKVIGMLKTLLSYVSPETRYIFSYADGTAGNRGIIYKATNFKELPPIKADFYILPDGTRVHPVTMWHRHKTRAWEAMQKIYPGIKKADGYQYRFLLDMGKRQKKGKRND